MTAISSTCRHWEPIPAAATSSCSSTTRRALACRRNKRHPSSISFASTGSPCTSPASSIRRHPQARSLWSRLRKLRRDADGSYYFPPKLNWTHIYGYVRQRQGSGGANWQYFTIDATGLPNLSTLIHELGHTLGL